MTSAPRALLALMVAAFLVRLAIWPWFDGLEPKIYDEDDYVEIATSLAERGEFAMNGRITAARPPLYPAVVAVIYRATGVDNHQAVRLFQIFLNVAIVPLIFLLGRRLYDQRTGVLAAALAVFYPSLLGHDYLLLTEVLFTLLLVAGTWALVENASRARWALVVVAGVAFGLGTLTRTSLLFYPPLFAVATFALAKVPQPRRIATVLLFTTVFGLTLAPWIARNTRLSGRLSSIDSYSNSTAARYSPLRHLFERAGSTWARRPPRERDGRAEKQRERARAGGPGAGAVQEPPAAAVDATAAVDAAAAGEAKGGPEGFGTHLTRAVSGVLWDGLLFWRIDREIAGAAARGWLGPLPRGVPLVLAASIAGYYVLLALAGLLGATLRPPSDRYLFALVLSVIGVLFAVHAFSVGHSRYHIPLMPLIAVFAARLWVARKEPLVTRRLVLSLALATVLIGSWIAAVVRFDLPDARERLERHERRSAPESQID